MANKAKKEKNPNRWGARKVAPVAFLVAFVLIFLMLPVKFGIFTITLVSIPVAIGAILYGVNVGLLLGTIWGLGSFAQAAMGMDLGPIFMGISPLLTFVVCVVPRALVGLLTGVIYKGMAKLGEGRKVVSYGVACISAPIMNTILFLGAIFLCFQATFVEYLLPAFTALLLTNAVPEAVTAVLVGVALATKLNKQAD